VKPAGLTDSVASAPVLPRPSRRAPRHGGAPQALARHVPRPLRPFTPPRHAPRYCILDSVTRQLHATSRPSLLSPSLHAASHRSLAPAPRRDAPRLPRARPVCPACIRSWRMRRGPRVPRVRLPALPRANILKRPFSMALQSLQAGLQRRIRRAPRPSTAHTARASCARRVPRVWRRLSPRVWRRLSPRVWRRLLEPTATASTSLVGHSPTRLLEPTAVS
jgi:hypothetical protein